MKRTRLCLGHFIQKERKRKEERKAREKALFNQMIFWKGIN